MNLIEYRAVSGLLCRSLFSCNLISWDYPFNKRYIYLLGHLSLMLFFQHREFSCNVFSIISYFTEPGIFCKGLRRKCYQSMLKICKCNYKEQKRHLTLTFGGGGGGTVFIFNLQHTFDQLLCQDFQKFPPSQSRVSFHFCNYLCYPNITYS